MARVNKQSILNDVSGGIGKQFVVKQYAHGTVLSAYPDMSHVKYSKLQKLKQGIFAQAVAFARSIVHNPDKKKAFAKRLKKNERVYNAAIKEYLRKHKG
ncbi:MAG TPA: hypothetical protein VK483_04640 [Chitinophagaceae bacterium]|nr:hypothetical protein [Chitinophagaceae bacterium]